LIAEETARFQSEVKLFKSVTQNLLLQNKNALKANAQSLVQQSQFAFKNRKDHLEMLKQSLIRSASVSCHSSREKLLQLGQSMRKDALSHLRQQSFLLNHRMQQMENGTKIIFRSQSVEIQNIEKNIHNMDPKNVLMRGYSITLLNGKAVKSFQTVKEGDTLKTVLFEGIVTSSVNSTSKSSNHE
jgi:exodeoxyribonuclease VII large subunit